ncbi:hypothetical protein HMPREF9711_03116 [Myroides odoratimimus CCUG 3837]|uniref:SGNH/GDSL hydrolase family protein n=1 Tax=Myroides odoratimimus TaxID=76832 RepID=UPI000280AC42|nr:SGNH/GDSL hydrolase family protein [Myroides odoratimimus]EKB02654.1 hypothetical protein HMPREF9711_03116 [Myroides odoratimimus CCUG 3837]
MSNPKLATEAQVQQVSDTFIEIINHQGKQIKALESGVIDAIEPSSPAPTKRGEYKVTKPGVFLNFKDANGQPISVTQEDYSSGNVSIIFNGVDCRVLIVPITFEGEVKEGDTRGVSGNTVNTDIIVPLDSIGIKIIKGDFFPSDKKEYLIDTVLLSDGKTGRNSGWITILNNLNLKKGKYKTNIYLTELVYLLTYDSNGNIVNKYNNKGIYDGSIEWEFELTDKEVSIRYCVREDGLDSYYFNSESANIDTKNSVFASQEYVDENTLKNSDSNLVSRLNSNYSPIFIDQYPITDFDKRAIVDIKLLDGNIDNLKDKNGNWIPLYLTFMRFKGYEQKEVSTTIIQISTSNSEGIVEDNKNIIANYSNDDSNGEKGNIDSNGYLNCIAKAGSHNNAVSLQIVLNHKYLRPGIDTNKLLKNKIKLNTAYIARIDKYYLNPLLKKKGLSLGDSVTEFGNYPSIIGQNLGMDWYNCGVGGTRMSTHTSAGYNKLSFYQIAEAISSGDFTSVNEGLDILIADANINDPGKARRLTTTKSNLNTINYSELEYISIFFGTNDFTSSKEIGDLTLNNLNVDTIVGALNYGIDKILSKHPHIKIIVITPTHRFITNKNNDSDTYSVGSKLLIDVVDALNKAANLNHLPFIDLYRTSNLSRYNHDIYFADTTHPNAKGYKYLGDLISKYINNTTV